MKPVTGFTLIEVMVVMVIIAILITTVSLSMKGDRAGEALEQEAQRLVALINLAREEAVMRDRDLGLVLEPQGYLFVQRNEDDMPSKDAQQAGAAKTSDFVPLLDDELLRPRELAPGSSLSFEVSQNARNTTQPSPVSAKFQPQILALAGDMLQPNATLILRHNASPQVERIAITADGARLLPKEAAP